MFERHPIARSRSRDARFLPAGLQLSKRRNFSAAPREKHKGEDKRKAAIQHRGPRSMRVTFSLHENELPIRRRKDAGEPGPLRTSAMGLGARL